MGRKKWKHWWKPLWNACETSKPLYETSIQSMFDGKNMAFNGCIISIWHFWAFSPVTRTWNVVQDWLGRDFCWRISSTKRGQNGANENVSNCKYRLTKLGKPGKPWDNHGNMVIYMERSSIFDGYPLVNVYITMENHHVQWENPLFLWPWLQ